MKTRTVESRAVRAEASRDNAERLSLIVPGQDQPISDALELWAVVQPCRRTRNLYAPVAAPLAGINLQHGLLSHRAEPVKTLEAEDGRIELRAVTGRTTAASGDHELVAAVMKIAATARAIP